MSFKAINNLIGLNRLVPTLLVFGEYSKMIELDAPFPSITQCAMAIQKAMDEIQRSTSFHQINDILNTRNGPSIKSMHDLPINLPILFYWEKNVGQSGVWKKSYELLNIQDKSVIIELPHDPTKFRGTSIKPYFIDRISINDNQLVP